MTDLAPADMPLPPAVGAGPGRLVLVVGPSGAGKDTLISLARDALAADAAFVFARRVVTRQATAAEDHDSASEEAFAVTAAAGDFAFWWRAHGLGYGVPAGIDAEIAIGRTVIVNVSRAVIPALRARYANVTVVLVTAPPEILAARLAARSRGSDGEITGRLQRAAADAAALVPEVVIENVGAPQDGAARLIALLRASVSHGGAG